jgi:hypothetical protein
VTLLSECDQLPDHTLKWAQALSEEIRQLRHDLRRFVEAPKTETFVIAEASIKAEIHGDIVMGNKSSTDSSVHISGTVGAFAQSGAVQIITGSINQRITSLQNDPETKPAADALKKLTDAVVVSQDIPSERERKRYLEDIEELTAQAARPKAEREKGVYGPIIDRLMSLCSGAGGLAAIWAVAGPTITTLFS